MKHKSNRYSEKKIDIRLTAKLYDQIVKDAQKENKGLASRQARQIMQDFYIIRNVLGAAEVEKIKKFVAEGIKPKYVRQ